MNIFNSILSKFFRILLIFSLSFIWVRFYESNLFMAIVFSSVLTFILDLLLTFWTKKHQNKLNLKNFEIKQAEQYCNHFIFNNKEVSINFFYNLLSKTLNANKTTNYIYWVNNEKTSILYPFYRYEDLSINDLIFIYNKVQKLNPNKIIICTKNVNKKTIDFSSLLNCNIILLNQFDVYQKILKPNNYYPETNFELKSTHKKSFRDILDFALNKKRAKGYIFSSFLLLISGFFVKLTIFYLIISSLLLILSIFSFTNQTYNQKIPENLL